MSDRHLDPTVSAPPAARVSLDRTPPGPPGGPRTPWWGRLDVPEGGCARLRLGPLTLYARNLLREWRLYSCHDPDPTLERVEQAVGGDVAHPADDDREWFVERFAQTREEGALDLLPRLADRAMVARPEVPISLIGGDEITLFVSTPLWVGIQTADTHRELTEIPSLRPSDTWFGSNTREGELCYAMRTRARIDVHELQQHPVRAITRITLHNRAVAPVLIERVNIPVPFLRLFAGADGLTWTDPITFERLEPGQHKTLDGRLRIHRAAPEEAGASPELLAGPRVEVRANVLTRALGAMLG